MPINPMYVQPLSFQQANPVLMGAQMGSDLVGSAFQNQIRNLQAQQMAMQNQVLPQTLQGQLQRLQLGNQAQGITNQYLPQTLQSDIGLKNAQTGLMGTEAGKNQFYLNHPETLLPGIAGQIGGISTLKTIDPSVFGVAPNTNGTPVTSGASATGQMLPAPSANQGGLAALNTPTNPLQQQVQPQNGQMFGGNPLANQLVNSLFMPMMKDQAQMQYYLARSAPSNNLPTDQKNQVFAQANAFGYDQTQTGQLLQSGKTLTDLALAKGFGADQSTWPDPVYAPTTAQRTQINRRITAASELNALSPQLTQALAPYSQRFDGYSPSQIADAMSNDNPDSQAKYLAARALQPEISAIRLKMMQGQVGIEAIRDLQNSSMGNVKAFQALVTPDVYKKANQYLDQWLNQATNIANSASSTGKMPDSQTLTNSLSGSNAVGTPGQNGAPATITATIGGKNYVKINGSWYQQ